MNTAEKIYELVKAMPEEQAGEILNFVEFVQQKARNKPTQTGKPLLDYAGILKDSPNLNGDPVEIHQKAKR